MFKSIFGKKKKAEIKPHTSEAQPQRKFIDPEIMKMKKALTLPKRFAQSLIELEIQVDRPDATKQHVQKLMDLYTSAIEYYNCINDYDNQQFFQNKLSALLNRTEIKKLVGTLPGRNLKLATAKPNDPVEMKKMIAQKRELKKFQDAVKLNIFNQEKQNDPMQDKQIDDQIRKQEEALKVVQREQLKQTEQFRQRLAERNRTQNNRSVQIQLSNDISCRIVNVQKENLKEKLQAMNKFETSSVSGVKLGNKLQHGFNRFNSNILKPSYGGDNLSIFSGGGKSLVSGGGGLASKISVALSRVVWNKNNSIQNDEAELSDLIELLEELNSIKDLTIKLNNQSKICKILETNEDLFFSGESQGVDVKAIMDECKAKLLSLVSEKDQAVEEYLESHTEEKFSGQQEIKMKFSKMINMLKNSKDPKKEEKMQNYEEKKVQELDELQKELNEKKKVGIQEIKEKYNVMSLQVKIDAQAIRESLKNDPSQIEKKQEQLKQKLAQEENDQSKPEDENDNGFNQQSQDYNVSHTGYIGESIKQQRQ